VYVYVYVYVCLSVHLPIYVCVYLSVSLGDADLMLAQADSVPRLTHLSRVHSRTQTAGL